MGPWTSWKTDRKQLTEALKPTNIYLLYLVKTSSMYNTKSRAVWRKPPLTHTVYMNSLFFTLLVFYCSPPNHLPSIIKIETLVVLLV